MSRIAPKTGEPAEPEKRRAFRQYDIDAAMKAQGGACYDCGAVRPLQADHDLPRDLLGKTDLANLRLRCIACHGSKTTGRDRPMIDKAARLRKSEAGFKAKRKAIVGRGFDRTKTRGFDGKVRDRG